MQSLRELAEQLPGKSGSAEDNLSDNLIAVAEKFGHDAVFGVEYEGILDIQGVPSKFVIKRQPISIVKLGQLLSYMERKAKVEQAELKKSKRKR